MERPKKEDYDFNDYLEGVRFAINMTKYVDYLEAKQLPIRVVSHQRELLELVTEIANSNQVYSNTRHKLWAKKLISSNCG